MEKLYSRTQLTWPGPSGSLVLYEKVTTTSLGKTPFFTPLTEAKLLTQWGPQFIEFPLNTWPGLLIVWLRWNLVASTRTWQLFHLSISCAELKMTWSFCLVGWTQSCCHLSGQYSSWLNLLYFHWLLSYCHEVGFLFCLPISKLQTEKLDTTLGKYTWWKQIIATN